ncbi:uncharacterized protein LOC117186744 [Drosophila miranda]|uniref:uncharacterized protein LOC117186744 n=1 Tax=Drosophila miranda TaxID=7229 RepID=UPI00143F38CA|nr:uncharacterized protein LOC117186744 [Drosophila miranda]
MTFPPNDTQKKKSLLITAESSIEATTYRTENTKPYRVHFVKKVPSTLRSFKMMPPPWNNPPPVPVSDSDSEQDFDLEYEVWVKKLLEEEEREEVQEDGEDESHLHKNYLKDI